ncbi:hypothetical protein CWI38_1834p0010 [Hamiltosporidium tvaerminnensis]|uniref:Uncharacterized protein n=1 Tax=Hamiltosporidium tvaerminnensis TaxID=1176355 RepID=A0A4Q9LQL1_9MICR|nr:hypothetical protein CWI38_1834p0010 [Hamiltosporidium tvaerminnensis]
MVQKRKKSRRLTIRRREGLKRKVRDTKRKEIRKLRKLEKLKEKVPTSLLRTDEDILLLNQIKKNTEMRQNNPTVINLKLDWCDLLEKCDVFLQILDSRDPEGSRNYEIENEIIKNNKKMIFIFNKTDLITEEVKEEWISNYTSKGITCISDLDISFYINNNGFNESIFCIIGEKNVGKKKILSYLLSENISIENIHLYETEVKEKNILSSLRNPKAANIFEIKECLNYFIKNISVEKICQFFKTEKFENIEEFFEIIAKENNFYKRNGKLCHKKAMQFILGFFDTNKILFYSSFDINGSKLYNFKLKE